LGRALGQSSCHGLLASFVAVFTICILGHDYQLLLLFHMGHHYGLGTFAGQLQFKNSALIF
jgi:hypothetical protein